MFEILKGSKVMGLGLRKGKASPAGGDKDNYRERDKIQNQQ